MNTKNIKISKIRLFFISLLFLLVLLFVYLKIVPSGKVFYSTNFLEKNNFITKLTPVDRVVYEESEVGIIGDPVYFSVFAPRRFDEAILTLSFKIFENPPVLEAGFLVDREGWNYTLEPITNKILNDLRLVWDVIESDGVVLLQKEKNYESIDDFLSSLPSPEKTAIYNYELANNYKLPDYIVEDRGHQILPFSLRGPWQYYTYVKDEKLDGRYIFEDLNLNDDEDSFDLMLFYGDTLIKMEHVDEIDDSESGEKEVQLSAVGLPEGIYRIEMRGNNDIVTKKLSIKQEKIAFSGKIHLYDFKDAEKNILTDSKRIQVTTKQPSSLQNIKAGTNEFLIDETYRQFETEVKRATATDKFAVLFFEAGELDLSGDGVFSFSEESFFVPRIKKVDRNLDVLGDGIEYIIANYNFPKDNNGIFTAKAKFDLSSAMRHEGKYGFMLSIPGLRADDGVNEKIEIKELRIDFKGATLFEKIRSIITKFL